MLRLRLDRADIVGQRLNLKAVGKRIPQGGRIVIGKIVRSCNWLSVRTRLEEVVFAICSLTRNVYYVNDMCCRAGLVNDAKAPRL